MEENNNDKQLIDLLNQLIQTQVQIAAIISTRFERQTTDNVKNKISQKKAWNAFVLTNFERSEKLVRTGVAAIAGLAKVCSCFLIRFAHILK